MQIQLHWITKSTSATLLSKYQLRALKVYLKSPRLVRGHLRMVILIIPPVKVTSGWKLHSGGSSLEPFDKLDIPYEAGKPIGGGVFEQMSDVGFKEE